MAKWCFICECEPVDDSDWYHCAKTAEDICPWCVRDMHKNLMKVNEINAKWEQWNMNIERIKTLTKLWKNEEDLRNQYQITIANLKKRLEKYE